MLHRLANLVILTVLLVWLLAPGSFAASAQVSTTVVFQNGVSPSSAYAGGTDTYLAQSAPTTTYGASSSMRLDGDDPPGTGGDLSALMRWDITAIPPGSVVESVSLTIYVTNSTVNPFPVYALKRSWSEREATWNLSSNTTAWEQPGASGPSDRGTTALATMQAATGSQTIAFNSAGIAVVQGWVNDPSTNLGLIAADTTMDDGLAYYANNSGTIANRPKLSITYQTGGLPTATSTPTQGTPVPPTPTSTALPSTMPKYVFLFIGDGMGFEHVKAGSYYLTGAAGGLSFEDFPYQGEVRTYSASSSVTDSAAAGTALATGHKVNNGVISVALPGDGSELQTLLEDAQQHGKQTGLVSTSYLTDATPGAFGAHETSRSNTAQIAGDYFNQTRPEVLLGGGGNGLTPALAQSAGYTVVADRAAMLGLSGAEAYVSGQFNSGYMPYEYDGMGVYPHLSEMTHTAIDLVDDDPDGFFLMVEGGLIDVAAHGNYTERVVRETVEFSNSVQVALDWASGRSDVLILVTADHETGGLTVTTNNGAGMYPGVTWSTTGHTAQNVSVYATGKYADRVYGIMNNTDIRSVVDGTRAPDPGATATFTATPGATFTATGTYTPTATNSATSTATATATFTDTATAFPTASATSSSTPTLTASATSTYTATSTHTPTATLLPPSATFTPTATSTPPPTATPTVPTGPVTVAFQNGVAPSSGYRGAVDTYLSQNKPNSNYGRAVTLLVDGDNPTGSGKDLVSLLLWDISAIPPGSVVESASIILQVSDISANTYPIYPLMRAWSAGSATWNRASTGINWQAPGASGRNDRDSTPIASITAAQTGTITIPLNTTGIALVQRWVDQPASNFGLIVAHPDLSDGLDFSSSEGAVLTSRPRLVITYHK